jgi:hypothetical protein
MQFTADVPTAFKPDLPSAVTRLANTEIYNKPLSDRGAY